MVRETLGSFRLSPFPMASQAPDLFTKGHRIDRYEIRELIGQGGMGAVYRAVDSKLGRTVALKTVIARRRGDALSEEVRQRFLREALAISKVDHRNVVQVLDFGFSDDGTPFLVMEYLRGKDLGALLKMSSAQLDVEYVVDTMLGVCAALRACHHVGIVHRDLKPGNIFLVDTDTGVEVKVLDFGVSKGPSGAVLTQEGQIVGTPQYLSPEQVEGTAGPESDQYALGVLMYVCLTKRLPFQDLRDLSLLRAIESGRFERPRVYRPDLPEGLEATILRAMRVSPADRFESVHALGQALWEFASPRGKDQWKNYYFHTPPVSRQAKQSSHGVAILEVMAQRSPPPARSTSAPTPAIGKLALLDTAVPDKPIQTRRAGPGSGGVSGSSSGEGRRSTKTEQPIQAHTASEPALKVAAPVDRKTGVPSTGRRVAIALFGAAAIGAAVMYLAPARKMQDAPVMTKPTAPAFEPTAVKAPAAAPVVPAAAVPTLEKPAAVVAPSPPPPATAVVPAERAQKTRPIAKRRKRETPKTPVPNIDQYGVGIPSE